MDCFLPIKTVKLHDNDKPWVTPEFKKIIGTRQKAFHHGKSPHYQQLRNQVNRESKKLRSTFLEKKLEQLKLNPNPKKWWQSIKQLSGYPKKKVLSTLVVGNQVMSGKALAENINDAFVSVTKEIPPLNRPHIDIYQKIAIMTFHQSLSLKKKRCTINYPLYQLLNLLVQMEYQTGF